MWEMQVECFDNFEIYFYNNYACGVYFIFELQE